MPHSFRRQRECYYGEAFIASNSKVDQHILQVYKGSKKKEVGFLVNIYVIIKTFNNFSS